MLPPTDSNQTIFDMTHPHKQREAPTLLALPKAITCGQVTIHEFHRKDEAKVHLDNTIHITLKSTLLFQMNIISVDKTDN